MLSTPLHHRHLQCLPALLSVRFNPELLQVLGPQVGRAEAGELLVEVNSDGSDICIISDKGPCAAL
jgi:hypothetical protein